MNGEVIERCASCGCVLTKDREDELCGNCWNLREMGMLDRFNKYMDIKNANAELMTSEAQDE